MQAVATRRPMVSKCSFLFLPVSDGSFCEGKKGDKTSIQKCNDTLYIQHPAELERFFSANIGQLKKFSCSGVTGKITQKGRNGKAAKIFVLKCQAERIWCHLEVTYCIMPGSLGVKGVLKNTKEEIKVCNLNEKQNDSNSLAKQFLFYLKTANESSRLLTRDTFYPCFSSLDRLPEKQRLRIGFKCMRNQILSFTWLLR